MTSQLKADPEREPEMTTVHHRYATVDGRRLFYREAGPAGAPAVVLLHGFPASSFMFRDLIPLLADRYHVIAPDHLGFGLSDAPRADEFDRQPADEPEATARPRRRRTTASPGPAGGRCSPTGRSYPAARPPRWPASAAPLGG